MKFFQTYKWLKISSIVLIVGIGLASFFIDVILEGLVKTRLQAAIQQDEDRLYDYQFESVKTRLLWGELILNKLEIIPRKATIDSISQATGENPSIYKIKLDYFKLGGLQTWALLLNNEILIGEIILEKAEVEIFRHAKQTKEERGNIAGEIIAPTLKLAMVDSFRLVNAKLIMHLISEDTIEAVSFDSLNFSLSMLKIDSSMLANKTYFDYESINLKIENIHVEAVKDFTIDLSELHFNPKRKSLVLENLSVQHELDKYAFMKTREFETDWIQLNVDKLSFENVDFKRYQSDGELFADEVLLDQPKVYLYRDKRMPDPPYKYKPLISNVLRNVDFDFSVGLLKVLDGNVTYQERIGEADKSGIISLSSLNLEAKGVTTIDALMSDSDSLIIHANGKFMGKGDITIDMSMHISDTTDKFYLKGRVDHLPFESLNQITEPLIFVKFEEGMLNYIDFHMVADDHQSKGRLDIDYEGLKKFTVLKKESEIKEKQEKGRKHAKEKKEKKLFSMLANTLMHKDYGPDDKSYYQGRIHFERNKDKAVFNYIVKSIQSGIMSTLLPNFQDDFKEMRKEKKAIQKAEKKAEKKEKKSRKRQKKKK